MNSRKLVLSIFCILLNVVTLFAQRNNTSKKFEYTESIEVPSATKEMLFNRASAWINDNFHNSDCRIRIQDKATGTIYGEATIASVEEGYAVIFSISFKINDGSYLYVINGFHNNSGNLEKQQPDCCMSSKKWNKLKTSVSAKTGMLIKSLKDKMKLKSPTDEFLTIPLIDTVKSTGQVRPGATTVNYSQPISFFMQTGAAYAPISYSNNSSSGGYGRRGGNNNSSNNSKALPVTGYHGEAGIFIPNKIDNSKGITLKFGYLYFPLNIDQTTVSYASGNAVNVEQTVTTYAGYIQFTPQYTITKKKGTNGTLSASFGIDIGITSKQNLKDIFGPDITVGFGKNGLYVLGTFEWAINNIYGSSSGGGFSSFRQSNINVQPLFLGAGLAFYPGQSKLFRKKHG